MQLYKPFKVKSEKELFSNQKDSNFLNEISVIILTAKQLNRRNIYYIPQPHPTVGTQNVAVGKSSLSIALMELSVRNWAISRLPVIGTDIY